LEHDVECNGESKGHERNVKKLQERKSKGRGRKNKRRQKGKNKKERKGRRQTVTKSSMHHTLLCTSSQLAGMGYNLSPNVNVKS